ncbi:MAG: enoyl-CoA hydratase/isomerase family protein, partial [Actinomycetota bacterium]
MGEPLTLQVVEGVATVTIDNPPINLFDLGLYIGMTRMAQQLADDPDVRVVVLRSANPEFFIAHFDVTLIQHLPTDAGTPESLNDFHAMCEAFRTLPQAPIAFLAGRVGGFCLSFS